MAYEKQMTDKCQTGIGTQTGISGKVNSPYVKMPGTGPSPSGQSQSEKRGTDNKAR